MSPESALFLQKARKLLGEAEIMLTVQLYDAAGRTAYLAGFHAAQAFISEQFGKTVRTHRGVQGELHQLIKDDPDVPADIRAFLSQTYNLKAVADYDIVVEVPPDRAIAAVSLARRFIPHFDQVLSGADADSGRDRP